MLVLSRKENQRICFPELGITIELLQVKRSQVRVGVNAPTEVRVKRDELCDPKEKSVADERVFRIPQSMRHDLRNELQMLSLSLHLFKRQQEKGIAPAESIGFEEIVERIERLAKHQVIASPTNPEFEHTAPKAGTALVVEDNDNERELLAGFLRMHGFRIATACDGQEALEYLQTHAAPEVVLLDMNMPRLNGAELIAQIREGAKFDDTLVFVISGEPLEENRAAISHQRDRWFQKPVDPQELVNALLCATSTRAAVA